MALNRKVIFVTKIETHKTWYLSPAARNSKKRILRGQTGPVQKSCRVF